MKIFLFVLVLTFLSSHAYATSLADIISASPQMNGIAVDKDLISYYRLDNNVVDTAGAHHGSPNAITYVSGIDGRAAYFNSNTDKINLNFNNNYAFKTISFWFKPEGNGYIVRKGNDFGIKISGSTLYVLSPSNGWTAAGAGPINYGSWYYIVAAFDSSDVRIFINGKDTTYWSSITAFATSSTNYMLGYSSDVFTGALDEVVIWDRVLSADEIDQLYFYYTNLQTLIETMTTTTTTTATTIATTTSTTTTTMTTTTIPMTTTTTGTAYYVSTSGDNAKDGKTPSTAWKTINYAITKNIVAGDSIYLKRGDIFMETIDVPFTGTAAKPITIGAYGTGAKPIIDAQHKHTAFRIAGKSYINLKDLDVRNGGISSSAGSDTFGVNAFGSHYISLFNLTVSGSSRANILISGTNNAYVGYCEAYNSIYEHGLYVDGYLPGTNSDNPIVEYNDLHDNKKNGLQFNTNCAKLVNNAIVRYNKMHNNHQSGVHDIGSTNSQFYYNSVYDNDDWNFEIGSDAGCPTYSASNGKIYNNVMYSSSGYGGGLDLFNRATGFEIKNNIIVLVGANTNVMIESTSSGSSTFDYNDYYGTGGRSDAHSITANPSFADAANKDYRIKSTSPLIDKGVSVGLSVDYYGNRVPQGLSTDIGFHEFVTTTTIPTTTTTMITTSSINPTTTTTTSTIRPTTTTTATSVIPTTTSTTTTSTTTTTTTIPTTTTTTIATTTTMATTTTLAALVADYRFDGDVTDYAYGNDGAVYGAEFTDRTAGNAAGFYGDDYIIIPNNDRFCFGYNNFTIMVWIKPISLATGKALVDKTDGTNGFRLIISDASSSAIKFIRGYGLSTGVATLSGSIAAGKWQHVAAVVAGNRVSIYINGTVKVSGTLASKSSSTATNMYIARKGFEASGIGFYNGLMDDLKIYNKALTRPEICAAGGYIC